MSNGSLDYHLHNNNNTTPLTWNLRLQICIGVAKGLNYLHTGIADQIITHGEMKANKILLDENWIPKVSGYGLWKVGTSGIFGKHGRTCPQNRCILDGCCTVECLFDWRQIIMTLARLNNAQESLSALGKKQH